MHCLLLIHSIQIITGMWSLLECKVLKITKFASQFHHGLTASPRTNFVFSFEFWTMLFMGGSIQMHVLGNKSELTLQKASIYHNCTISSPDTNFITILASIHSYFWLPKQCLGGPGTSLRDTYSAKQDRSINVQL